MLGHIYARDALIGILIFLGSNLSKIPLMLALMIGMGGGSELLAKIFIFLSLAIHVGSILLALIDVGRAVRSYNNKSIH